MITSPGKREIATMLYFDLWHVYDQSWFVFSTSWCHWKAVLCDCGSSWAMLSYILDSTPPSKVCKISHLSTFNTAYR